MKKIINYKDGQLTIEYKFNKEHIKTLFIIKANDGYVSFKNRDSVSDEDLDGNDISWMICDDLVSMGLLVEDEEAFDVSYSLTDDGKNLNIIS